MVYTKRFMRLYINFNVHVLHEEVKSVNLFGQNIKVQKLL